MPPNHGLPNTDAMNHDRNNDQSMKDLVTSTPDIEHAFTDHDPTSFLLLDFFSLPLPAIILFFSFSVCC